MAFVQSASNSAVGQGSVTVTLSAGTGSGNLLLVVAVMSNSTSILSLSYTGTSQSATSIVNPTGTNTQMQLWYVPNCASGTTAVTITRNTGTGPWAAAVLEWSGIATSSPLDQQANHNTQGTPGGTIDTGTTPATGQASELLWAVFGAKDDFSGGNSPTYSSLSSGWTQDQTTGSTGTTGSTAVSVFDAYQTVSATGTYSASISTSTNGSAGNGNEMGAIATFKTPAAALPAIPLINKNRKDVWRPAEFWEAFRSVLLVKRLSGILEARIVGERSFEKWVGRQRAWA